MRNPQQSLALPEMTPQKLWVLKAHTKINENNDFCQNLRQDFRIYRNIDHQKAKVLKSNNGKKNKTHKQTKDRTSKQTNTQRNEKNKQAVLLVCFLVRRNGWSHCVRPNETNKKTSKESRK